MCTKPCIECPFKVNSLPGYLGTLSNEPEEFLDLMEYEIMGCHMKIDWGTATPSEVRAASLKNPCIGGLQFLRNSCKLPRLAREKTVKGITYSKLMDSVNTSEKIFRWKGAFIDHHS
jgi:hypothetical protein